MLASRTWMSGDTCIGCGSERSTPFLHKDGPAAKHRNVVLRRCERCGLRFLEGWSGDFDAELYEYYAARRGQSKAQRYPALNTARHRELLSTLGEQLRGRRLLDVGCGEGQLVDTAVAMGWECRGIDLARPAIEICRGFGLPCEELDFFSPELDGDRFELLVMSELIEHVPAPGRFLERAQELLEPGGLVYVTTPNFNSATRLLAGSDWKEIHREHLTYFTPRTFRELVRRTTGLEIVSVETKNIGVASLLSRFRRRRGAAGAAASATRAAEQGMRSRVEGSRALRGAKHALNRVLSVSGRGDTAVVILRKPLQA